MVLLEYRGERGKGFVRRLSAGAAPAGGVSSDLSGRLADRLGVEVASQPALGTAPVVEHVGLRDAGQLQHRGVVGQREAPEGSAVVVGEEGQALLAQGLPEVRLERVAAEPFEIGR